MVPVLVMLRELASIRGSTTIPATFITPITFWGLDLCQELLRPLQLHRHNLRLLRHRRQGLRSRMFRLLWQNLSTRSPSKLQRGKGRGRKIRGDLTFLPPVSWLNSWTGLTGASQTGQDSQLQLKPNSNPSVYSRVNATLFSAKNQGILTIEHRSRA